MKTSKIVPFLSLVLLLSQTGSADVLPDDYMVSNEIGQAIVINSVDGIQVTRQDPPDASTNHRFQASLDLTVEGNICPGIEAVSQLKDSGQSGTALPFNGTQTNDRTLGVFGIQPALPASDGCLQTSFDRKIHVPFDLLSMTGPKGSFLFQKSVFKVRVPYGYKKQSADFTVTYEVGQGWKLETPKGLKTY